MNRDIDSQILLLNTSGIAVRRVERAHLIWVRAVHCHHEEATKIHYTLRANWCQRFQGWLGNAAERTMDQRYRAQNTCQTSSSEASGGHPTHLYGYPPCIASDNYRSWRSRDSKCIIHELSGHEHLPILTSSDDN
jgi:hypothetical protein